jgi:hypothetical protein
MDLLVPGGDLNSHNPFGFANLSPILKKLQENAGRCIFSQTYDSKRDLEEVRFAVDCTPGQQIPKRSITKDVVAPDRQKGHAYFEISAAETNAKTPLGRG